MKTAIAIFLISCTTVGGWRWDPQYPQFEACEFADAPKGTRAKFCRDYEGDAWLCTEDGNCSSIFNYR